MTWLAFGWARPAFPADAPAPQVGTPPSSAATQVSDDANADSQPVEAVTFLGTGVAAPAMSAPADKPVSTLRIAPIAVGFGGDVGYDIEQTSSNGASPTLRQRVLLNLRGRASSYISQPWIAKVRSNLGLTSVKSKADDTSSSSNTLSGDASLLLVPYSRFPFDAMISRNQNYSGPGIGTPISQTTRLDLNQRYTPRAKKESYHAGYNRSQTASGGLVSDRHNGLNFDAQSMRLEHQSLELAGARANNFRTNDGQTTSTKEVVLDHEYLPNEAFSLRNNASMLSSSEHIATLSTNSRFREMNSILSYQPREPYSIIGAARVNAYEFGFNQSSSRSRTVNANLGGNYRPSQYINLSASGNVNLRETNSVRTRTVSTSQNASANYPLAAMNLGAYRYASRINGSVSNRTDPTGNTQSLSLNPSHGLKRGMDLGSGKLNLGLDQSLSLSETTRTQATSTLNHSGTASWRSGQGKSDTSLTLNARDTRVLSSTKNVFQSVHFSANVGEEFSRDSRLSSTLTVQVTRQLNQASPNANVSTSSSFSLQYSNLRAFNVPRLAFTTSVRAHSKALIPALVAPPAEQGPLTWENTLAYVAGRLTAEFKVNLSKEGDGTTQSLIGLYLKRYF